MARVEGSLPRKGGFGPGWAVAAICLAVFGLQAAWLTWSGHVAADDFVQYWTAGRLVASGESPYEPAQVLALQRSAGWDEGAPLMMSNPPWALALAMPLGAPNYPTARLGWLALSLGAVVLSIGYLWRSQGGSGPWGWLALAVGFAFLPVEFVLHMGQITPWVLLGVVGLLYFLGRRSWLAAGGCLALVMLKPQVAYLALIALLFWIVEQRRWRVLLGGAIGCAAGTAVALAANPQVIGQYVRFETSYKLLQTAIAQTPAMQLRLAIDPRSVWPQFLPAALAVIWLVAHWRRQRGLGRTWDWNREMPLLVLVSLATVPYAFLYDQSMLLIAIIPTVAWLARDGRRRMGWGWAAFILAVNALILVPYLPGLHASFLLIWPWVAPALLAGYLVVRRTAQAGATGPAM